MLKLKLTARSEGRNERHARIGVFQNGGKAGVLTISAEYERPVLEALNGCMTVGRVLYLEPISLLAECAYQGPPTKKWAKERGLYADGYNACLKTVQDLVRGTLSPEMEVGPELLKAARVALAHIEELRDAWQCGALTERDGQGGERSNRNVDVETALRNAIAKAEPI